MEALVLAQLLHPTADRAVAIAEIAQDRVHPGVNLVELGQSDGVDFVGRKMRGGARAQGPGVILVAARLAPHPGVLVGERALGLELGELALERGHDRTADDRLGARLPVTRDCAGPAGQPLDVCPATARVGDRRGHRGNRLVEQEPGRDEPFAARLTNTAKFAFEDGGDLFEPRQVGFSISPIAHRVLGTHEARKVEIGADVLDHHVRRVAPTADRDIPIRQREPVERGGVGALHDFEAGAGRGIERRGIDRARPTEIASQDRRERRLARRRAIGQPAPQGGMLTGVDAERRRLFGVVGQQVPRDVVKQRAGRGSGADGLAPGKRGQRNAAKPREGLAAGEFERG